MTHGGCQAEVISSNSNHFTPDKSNPSGKQVLSSLIRKDHPEGRSKSLTNNTSHHVRSSVGHKNNKLLHNSRKLSQSLTEFTLGLLEENQTSQSHGLFSLKMPVSFQNILPNSSMTPASMSSSPETDIHKSFTAFVDFIHSMSSGFIDSDGQPNDSSREVCLAFFLHCFVHLFENAPDRIPAKKFYLKNSSLIFNLLNSRDKPSFPPRLQHFNEIFTSIASFSNSNTLNQLPDLEMKLKSISRKRRLLLLPQKSLDLLFKFLEESKDMILSRMVHDFVNTLSLSMEDKLESSTSSKKRCLEEDLLKELEKSIDSVKNLYKDLPQSRIPSVSLFSVAGTGICCASSPIDHSGVVYGSDNRVEVINFTNYSSNTNELSADDSSKINNRQTFVGHSGRVFGVSYLPSSVSSTCSSFVLSCSQDSSLRLWDIDSGGVRCIYSSGHLYSVWCQDISPLGMYFASGSKDATVKMWTFDRTTPLRILAGHTQDVNVVKFHPNCKYIASGSCDKSVRLWSVTDAKAVRMFPGGHKTSIFSLAFTPDGHYLASAGEDRKIKIWDMRTNKALREYRGHTDIIKDLTFNSAGSLLVSSSLDGSVKVWDASLIKSSPSSSSLSTSSSNAESSVSITSSPLSTHMSPVNASKILHSSFSHRTDNLLFSIGIK